MVSTDALIILFGAPAVGLLIYIAMTLQQLLAATQAQHNDIYHHIYKDRL